MNLNLIAEVESKEEGVNLVIRTTDTNAVVISIESAKLAVELSVLKEAIEKLDTELYNLRKSNANVKVRSSDPGTQG